MLLMVVLQMLPVDLFFPLVHLHPIYQLQTIKSKALKCPRSNRPSLKEPDGAAAVGFGDPVLPLDLPLPDDPGRHWVDQKSAHHTELQRQQG